MFVFSSIILCFWQNAPLHFALYFYFSGATWFSLLAAGVPALRCIFFSSFGSLSHQKRMPLRSGLYPQAFLLSEPRHCEERSNPSIFNSSQVLQKYFLALASLAPSTFLYFLIFRCFKSPEN